ncbi:DNA (cytosine-5)-methyltransferase 1 [Methylobacter tundripaludum]|uniref:Cytosine-specific methyltransferase n=1 Tax=Methylobacter tundripaludum TaxID=173365 RepID=A0A2S6HEJ6_9GAMM|nr:DNA (cytosine-5-)-methyltransferase [Methylobacter tundripaludum]PPK75919.1 DNA (cytosine-5)-methyltransferase 1 [Methylobacter tundripaludum]
MKFIDLFAGLGGFHTGFSNSGFECVFACEIDSDLRALYKSNYGIEPYGDVTKIAAKDIPNHDVLCAGFPCQPFSLAGKKKGADCPSSGMLIDDIVRIAAHHKPKFVVMENVPNILTIANGTFWEYIVSSFESIGYVIEHKVISPVEIGIPQNRKRIFVVASRNSVVKTQSYWPTTIQDSEVANLRDFLDSTLEHKPLEHKKKILLAVWQNLLDNCTLPLKGAFSIVAPEFGANYPLEFGSLTLEQMKQYRGAYGESLAACTSWTDVLKKMPSYAQKNKKVSDWIISSVQQSREIYSSNKDYLDMWIGQLEKNYNSWQILEWRGKLGEYNIYSHLIQFRASGIRVLKPEIAPSLIAMTPTQIPVIPSENRYMSKAEAAKLQFLHTLPNIPDNTPRAFKALGNAVNAKIVELIANNLRHSLATYQAANAT